MKAEVKHSMNIADSNANNSHSTDQSGCGHGRGHSTTTNPNATPVPHVPHAVTTTPTAHSDSPSAIMTPTHQVNTAQIMPSPGGPTSTHMDSGPPILLRQMLSNASTRSQ